MQAKQIYKGRAVTEYIVSDILPDAVDYDVITFCDRGNFGGRVVRLNATTAKVYVYTD